MKTKIFPLFLLAFSLILIFFALPQLRAEEVTAEAKLEALRAEHHDYNQVGQNTLAAPLVSATATASVIMAGPVPVPLEAHAEVESLLNDSTQIGTKGDLSYDQIAGGGLRLRLTGEDKESSLFFSFDGPKDLRNRWVRVRYSGLAVPEFLTLRFDGDESRKDSDFKIYLENSLEPQEVFFKLPDKTSFSDTHSLRSVMAPKEKLLDADFMIEGLDILAAGQEPVSLKAGSNPSRFDWNGNSFEDKSKVSLNAGSIY